MLCFIIVNILAKAIVVGVLMKVGNIFCKIGQRLGNFNYSMLHIEVFCINFSPKLWMFYLENINLFYAADNFKTKCHIST